jgi:hypothetical protein
MSLRLLTLALSLALMTGCPSKDDKKDDDSSSEDDSGKKKKKKKKKKKDDDEDEDADEDEDLADTVTTTTTTSCLPCRTQEDLDAVLAQGRSCCFIRACNADSDCGSRVCCKIAGRLCMSSNRCPASLRVSAATADDDDGKPVEKPEEKPEEKPPEKPAKLGAPCNNNGDCAGIRCCLINKKKNLGMCMVSTACVQPK